MRVTRRGFTLAELAIVVGIMGVILAIAVPNYLRSVRSARENKLKTDLAMMRAAINQFYVDTSAFPQSLSQLNVAPTGSTMFGTYRGASVTLTPSDWRGPYLNAVPLDPVAKAPYIYSTSPTFSIKSAAAGTDLVGVPYANY